MSNVSQSEDLVIVGGGEHATVVADAVRAGGAFRLIGYVDLHEQRRMRDRWMLPYLGADSWLAGSPEAKAVLGVGGVGVSSVRNDIVARIDLPAERWQAVVHPSAWVSPTVHVGPGVVIMAGAIVQTGARLGAHAIINSGAVIEHDVVVGAFALIGPRVTVGGGSQVGAGSFVGLGSCIRDHVRIGSRATIAMGAVVTRDVDANVAVRGVPAHEWRR